MVWSSSGLRKSHDAGAPPAESKPAKSKARSEAATSKAATSKAVGPAPTEATLREAAVSHLARYEATRDGLIRVLDRRVSRWSMRAEGAKASDAIQAEAAAARDAARRVADALVASGAVDDTRFAERRAALHARSGRSSRASRALLGVLGVAPKLAGAAAARDADLELEAAAAHARRRRLGPFAPAGRDPQRQRALASFARAGFGSEIAREVLSLDLDAAERLIARLRARG